MEHFIGEIKLFAGDWVPAEWAPCDGRLLTIKDNEALYTLLGTAYGGDGQQNFAVPDLRGRVPVHRSQTIHLGASGGVEEAAITKDQVAAHQHMVYATTAPADRPTPTRMALASSNSVKMWSGEDPNQPFAQQAISPAPGNGTPHENMHPFLVITYIIALGGQWPTPS